MHVSTTLAVVVTALSSALSVSATCSKFNSVTMTFYGYPDNDPPGADTAYNCGGRNYVAGGSGSYSDPITFATAPGEFSKCEIIYIPYLKKYARMEDYCEQCSKLHEPCFFLFSTKSEDAF